jgi:hypothetical protein
MELSVLTQKRREHIQSCRDNNDNSHEIIAGLYSDPSHFIYEILQNADDAGASEVNFELISNSLSITHNGKKLFNFNDVDSITTVGSSTKKDDVNSIGTFGAGFKSVFAITKTPHIHSGNYHFKITNFIVPEEIESLNIRQNTTAIILPFNHQDISTDNAYKQISNRLKALESESLLFLRNIKEIQWKTESDSGHYLSEVNGNKASLISQVNEEDSLIEYFLCTKNIEVDNTKLNIVVAYPLDRHGAVDSVHDSKLFVFFPTNERTGLKFLVHAPYKTTPSRESIPFDDVQNQLITKELSCLVAESIIGLKISGLLNVNVLSVLPIDPENEHPLYNAAFHQVKSIFSRNSLLPTANGEYESSNSAILAREKELTNLLEGADCSRLFNRNTWLSTDITYDKTRILRDYLTGELDIPEITMQKFCSEITEDFIVVKSDSWMIEFYTSISKNKALYRDGSGYQKKGVLRDRPIIRLEDGSQLSPENNLGDIQVYLPTTGKSKFKTVKRALAENEASHEFLRSLGLEKPSNIAEINEFIIPKYQGDYIELDEYTEDFDRVMMIWQQSDEYRRKEIIDLLRKSQFIHSVNQNGEIIYQIPDEVYFPTEKLSAWFNNNLVDDIYFQDPSIKLTEQKRKFIEGLGVKYDLIMSGITDVRITRHGWYKRSVNGFNPEFCIHGLEYSLNNITIERSTLLWAILLKNTNKLKGYIETKTNQNYPYSKGQEETSRAMGYLNNHLWLYDSSGEIIDLPMEQIALENLSNEYQKEDENIEKLVKVLGLKLDKVSVFEEETGLKVVNKEEFDEFEKWKEDQAQDSDESTDESDWKPEVNPEDATPIQDDADWIKEKTEDLSGQGAGEGSIDSGQENSDHEENSGNNESVAPKNSKQIGDWGEAIARKYLMKKYPANDVVWLNKNGCIGKGYDFVIRGNGEDIAYYEIKSKTDESPMLFQVSGTQWNWAKQLHRTKKGDMYKILVILNAGTKQPKIREINNPVGLWKSEKLYADPVNIEL